jgi:hypothetical protein
MQVTPGAGPARRWHGPSCLHHNGCGAP